MKYIVSEQVEINALRDRVYPHIADLSKWKIWDPWDFMDPESITEESDFKEGLARKTSWKGKFVGEGHMSVSHTSEKEIYLDLVFTKPFKSKAKISFYFQEVEGKTQVKWEMKSTLPFFLFFLKATIVKSVSNDFSIGLRRLKYIVEQGEVPAQLEFVDVPQSISGFKFFGTKVNQLREENLSTVIPEKFAEVHKGLAKQKDIEMRDGYCFCDKVKFSKGLFDLSMGYAYQGEINQKESFITKTIPPHKAIKVILTGDYEFIKDAWTAIMMHSRGLKVKPDKRVSPYENYIKGPHNSKDPKKYITEICFPVR